MCGPGTFEPPYESPGLPFIAEHWWSRHVTRALCAYRPTISAVGSAVV